MLNNKEFGALIAARRREVGLTQDAFAAMLGITPQAISKWENGVGYPDVTLFPIIAQALNISLDELFGTDRTSTKQEEIADEKNAHLLALTLSPDIPQAYCSLPPVASGEHFVCFSDKHPAESDMDAGLIHFTDGSSADLNSGEVENRGTGEIRMLPIEKASGAAQQAQENTPQMRRESFAHFHSIQLLCRGCGEVTVKTSPDGQGHIEVSGPAEFLKSVSASVKDETLTLELAPMEQNGSGDTRGKQVIVWLPVASGKQFNAHITGCCTVKCEPAFPHTDIHITGCGDLRGNRAQTLTMAIYGCGEVHWGAAQENTSITVNGCGSVALDYAANPHINISGSGTVTLRQVSGSMSTAISGSGDVTAAGELDSFNCYLNGAGTVYGEQLSVNEASIVINSAASVRLGRIRSYSKEKIHHAATYRVDHRGNPVSGTAHLPLK